ncbi:MAG: peptide chain release factor N(5)-glutamine methyltransferase [Bacteroidota bacterium]|nr:peptide chain release factor N(5)-glutamine methyltransferase [Bacteroidota bacterium]
MTLREAQQETLLLLKKHYDSRESANICDWVMEHITGQTRIDRLINKEISLTEAQKTQLQKIQTEIDLHKPIQYILGEAWFGGYRFLVSEDTLIPRPETEELVEWICSDYREEAEKPQDFLDVGTGSGCIPVLLKKKLPAANLSGLDISEKALAIARKNAGQLDVRIQWMATDFLNETTWDRLPTYDLIVSNPPYIKRSEEKNLASHVLDFEPGLALFVPDDDALLFYRKLADFATTHLTNHGHIYVEINESLGMETLQLFTEKKFQAVLKQDMQGKDRMIKAWKKR